MLAYIISKDSSDTEFLDNILTASVDMYNSVFGAPERQQLNI